MHKFNPINKNKLDNPKRREIFPQEPTLKKLGLREIELRCKEEGINNISIVKSSEYDLKLEDKQVSFAL